MIKLYQRPHDLPRILHALELHRQRDILEVKPAPPTRRMVLEVPEEWFLLFAWISNRERYRRRGENSETGLTAERIGLYDSAMRKIVNAYMWTVLNDQFHAELHDLAIGRSDLLRSQPPKAESPGPWRGDPDDELPF